MTINKVQNGALNNSRDTVNENISKLSLMGGAKRLGWNSKRSFRSI